MTTLVNCKVELGYDFNMKDLGECRMIFGMETRRSHPNISLSPSQSCYTKHMMEWFGKIDAEAFSALTEASLDLSALSGESCTENYRKAISALICLMLGTQPDNALLGCSLARYVRKLLTSRSRAVQRVLKYFIHTKSTGLC